VFTGFVQGRRPPKPWIRSILQGALGIPIASLISFAVAQFSHVVVDFNQIPNGHKPKVIGDFANNGSAGIGALSAGQGFKLYRYPVWASHLITSYNNGSGDEDAQVADVNGDGALDIVIGGLSGNTYWLENPLKQGKDPYNSTWSVHQIQSGRPSHDVAVGDIDRDGKVDVATESGIYLQGSTPDNWTFVGAPQINRSVEGTSIGDLLGDGYLDVIAPYQNGFRLAWFENPLHSGGNPVTDTWRVHIIDSNPGFSGDMTTAVADFNRDGRRDIAMSPMYNDGYLVWYEEPPDPRNGTWSSMFSDPRVIFTRAPCRLQTSMATTAWTSHLLSRNNPIANALECISMAVGVRPGRSGFWPLPEATILRQASSAKTSSRVFSPRTTDSMVHRIPWNCGEMARSPAPLVDPPRTISTLRRSILPCGLL